MATLTSIAELSNDELRRVFSFLDYKELFNTLPRVNSNFKKVLQSKYPYWKFLYDNSLIYQEFGVNTKELRLNELVDKQDYRQLFKMRFTSLIRHKKELFDKLDKLQQDTDIDIKLYAKIKDFLSKNLRLLIGFEGKVSTSSLQVGKSRFATKDFDVPKDNSISADWIVLQIDLSILKNTICSQLYNLPTHGMLYYKTDDFVNGHPSCHHYAGTNLKRVTTTLQENVLFGINFTIEKAVEYLALPPIEDFPELLDLVNPHLYNANDEEEAYRYICVKDFSEQLRRVTFLHNKSNKYCNLQMFGYPYYPQQNPENITGNKLLLFQYYTSGGNCLCYVSIDKLELINRDYSNVKRSVQG
jgi:hypothetical protein